MILPKGALVAVVDGEKLVMFKNTGDQTPELTALPTPDIDGDGGGTGGHASSSANPDESTKSEDGYAAGVAAALNKQALTNQFEHLFVVAAPKTLGELRKHWHKALEAKLVGELAKDLTGQSADAIATAIAHA
ncbi:host attachment family protein [Caulobacter sp. DWR2-3-1b2]|uniref:host attachment family protein n=1 Tax=unclassified Caulobacter TaxID=2648921 RepID=UPI0019B38126|nr:host attachment protein [Caulobacter sp.]